MSYVSEETEVQITQLHNATATMNMQSESVQILYVSRVQEKRVTEPIEENSAPSMWTQTQK